MIKSSKLCVQDVLRVTDVPLEIEGLKWRGWFSTSTCWEDDDTDISQVYKTILNNFRWYAGLFLSIWWTYLSLDYVQNKWIGAIESHKWGWSELHTQPQIKSTNPWSWKDDKKSLCRFKIKFSLTTFTVFTRHFYLPNNIITSNKMSIHKINNLCYCEKKPWKENGQGKRKCTLGSWKVRNDNSASAL